MAEIFPANFRLDEGLASGEGISISKMHIVKIKIDRVGDDYGVTSCVLKCEDNDGKHFIFHEEYEGESDFYPLVHLWLKNNGHQVAIVRHVADCH